MHLQLEAVSEEREDALAAASAAQADKHVLQRQLSVSTDSNERLQAALETQYAPPCCAFNLDARKQHDVRTRLQSRLA